MKQDIEDLKKQILELNDRYTETKQKLEKQNLEINLIGEHLLAKKPDKKKFAQDWKSISETNIKSPKIGTLTSKYKPEQEKPNDD